MNPTLQLLAALADPARVAGELALLDDAQLAAGRQMLADHARAVRAGEVAGTDPDDIPTLSRIRDAAKVLTDEQGRRTSLPQAAGASRRPSLAALNAARPEAARPRPGELVTRPRWELSDGTATDFADRQSIAERIAAAIDDARHYSGGADRIRVASIRVPFGDDLRVQRGEAERNDQKLAAVTAAAREPWTEEQQAIVASGGWCAPLSPDYDVPSVADDARPFRDALPRIGADRGGVTFTRAARLSSIVTGGPSTANAAVNLWTAATDETPGGNTKQRQTISCPTVLEEELDAVVVRLRFGNLGARAFPEHVRASVDVAMAAHARIAERNLIDRLIADMNTDVSQTGFLGTSRDLKHHALQVAAQIRSVERLSDSTRVRAAIAREALDMVVADITMQQPGDDALGWDRDRARAHLASTGVLFSYVQDTSTGADAFVTNADTQALADWPDDLEIPFWVDGTAVYLDGGELNLGIVRDSTLNDTNDYEIFVETFEGLAWRGPFGVTLTLTTCPAGDSQVATDSTGSLCSGS